MASIWGRLNDFVRDEDGAAASEYAVLVAFVVIAALVALRLFDLSSIYAAVSNSVKNAVNNQG